MKNMISREFSAIMGILFIIYSFNNILFLNFQLINVANIVFLLAIITIIISLMVTRGGTPDYLFYTCLLTGFLAGINITSKPKLLVFLMLVYLLWILMHGFAFKNSITEHLHTIILNSISFIVSIFAFLLMINGNLKPLFVLLTATVLFFLQIIQFILLQRNAGRSEKISQYRGARVP